jgi:hypothetical protein
LAGTGEAVAMERSGQEEREGRRYLEESSLFRIQLNGNVEVS